MNKTYCTSSDLIPIEKGFFYLEKDNTIYKKATGQNYKPIKKLDFKPKIKVTNKEFNHKKTNIDLEKLGIIIDSTQ